VELRTQFEVNLSMAVVEHKRSEFRSGETFMECDKAFSFRRNSSQDNTEGLPNTHGKSLDIKYEDIYKRILYRKSK
jgi:hypothetical protein